MENNNKSYEELADEALDKVAGGAVGISPRDAICVKCNRGQDEVSLGVVHVYNPNCQGTKNIAPVCEDCYKQYYSPKGDTWTKLNFNY